MWTGFVAYPSAPQSIGHTIRNALSTLASDSTAPQLASWEENDIAGRFLSFPILSQIEQTDVLVADITRLNFNVLFEVGYAIGRRKRTILTKNDALVGDDTLIRAVGIFDTLGYASYTNSERLVARLKGVPNVDPLTFDSTSINATAPVYLVKPKVKTDVEIRLISRMKKARLQFRSFDPEEQGRLAASEAIENVAQSHGVIVPLLPADRIDATVHNLRGAFVAGLTLAMEKELLLLQEGEDPVPLDYRDLVCSIRFPDQIDEYVANFSTDIGARFQRAAKAVIAEPKTFLERLHLGSTFAENELQDLANYYLETDEFRRALRGEVRVVMGRKGVGKTALFTRLHDKICQNRSRIVVDLKPEGFQLRKFRERVLQYLEEGTREHTITAFWEYLLLLEMCYKVLQQDRVIHMRDHRLFEPYSQLAAAYYEDEYISEGDFSERMLQLTQHIADDFATFSGSRTALSSGQITELLYRHDLPTLRNRIVEYLTYKDGVWLLFDNLDKGWPTHGVAPQDVLVLRCLIDAMNKIERELSKRNVECHAIIFIRNDVYELLVDHTPDRGKVASVTLDWTDPELLREVLRRRLLHSEVEGNPAFDDVWRQIAVSHIKGEESSQYLIERSLMRPRALLELIRECRGHAVNLGHDRIEVKDIEHGEADYSTKLLNDIAYELRDIHPHSEGILHTFTESGATHKMMDVHYSLHNAGFEDPEKLVDFLLWYAFFGLVREDGDATYIYDVKYDMRKLKALIARRGGSNAQIQINPAFWRALDIKA